jgi:hypothetical protein
MNTANRLIITTSSIFFVALYSAFFKKGDPSTICVMRPSAPVPIPKLATATADAIKMPRERHHHGERPWPAS